MIGKILAVWLVSAGMAVGQTATTPVAAARRGLHQPRLSGGSDNDCASGAD